MTRAALRERLGTFPNGVAVIVLAVGMSFADGFWVVSLREAAGAAIRTGRPFASWLVDCTVVLPLFVLAVAAGCTPSTCTWKSTGPSCGTGS